MGGRPGRHLFWRRGGLGLTVISSFLLDHQTTIRLFGGSFLILLGFRTMFGPKILSMDRRGRGRARSRIFFATFLLALSNPATIAGAFGVFAALGRD